MRAIRRFELFYVVSAFLIYIIFRLFQEADNFRAEVAFAAEKSKLPSNIILNELVNYNYGLNTLFPIIAGAGFFLLAWYFFHYKAYPKFKQKKFDDKMIIYTGLFSACIAASVFLFYFFTSNVRLTDDSQRHVTGLTADSIYNKKSIFSDIFAVLILIGVYELFSQMHYYLYKKLNEGSKRLKYLSYFTALPYLVLPVVCFMVGFAMPEYTSVNLWTRALHLRDLLMISGWVVQLYVVQAFIYRYLLPQVNNIRSSAFLINTVVYLSACLGGNLILWIAYMQFNPLNIIKVTALFFVTVFIAFIAAYIRKISAEEKTVLETNLSNKSAELSNLRSQINPHFLFNALNSLYTAALKEGSIKAADGIQKLGDMMRFMLQENNRESILLSKEIEYLHNYIQIQRMRIDESSGADIKVSIQSPDREISLAPMLLSPFIENAFKHGISLMSPSWIYITLSFDASKLYFKVHNSVHRKQKDQQEDNSGVGLENVKKRLELIYTDRYDLDISSTEKDYFVSLTLDY